MMHLAVEMHVRHVSPINHASLISLFAAMKKAGAHWYSSSRPAAIVFRFAAVFLDWTALINTCLNEPLLILCSGDYQHKGYSWLRKKTRTHSYMIFALLRNARYFHFFPRFIGEIITRAFSSWLGLVASRKFIDAWARNRNGRILFYVHVGWDVTKMSRVISKSLIKRCKICKVYHLGTQNNKLYTHFVKRISNLYKSIFQTRQMPETWIYQIPPRLVVRNSQIVQVIPNLYECRSLQQIRVTLRPAQTSPPRWGAKKKPRLCPKASGTICIHFQNPSDPA